MILKDILNVVCCIIVAALSTYTYLYAPHIIIALLGWSSIEAYQLIATTVFLIDISWPLPRRIITLITINYPELNMPDNIKEEIGLALMILPIVTITLISLVLSALGFHIDPNIAWQYAVELWALCILPALSTIGLTRFFYQTGIQKGLQHVFTSCPPSPTNTAIQNKGGPAATAKTHKPRSNHTTPANTNTDPYTIKTNLSEALSLP